MIRVHFEDWTPFLEEPVENSEGKWEVDESAVAVYEKAREDLITAHQAMLATKRRIEVR
jgi:hypothetical protein